MEKPKKLKIKDMLLLDEYNLKYTDYLFLKEDFESVTFLQKSTGKKVTLRR